jgi:hypothetical protein
VDETTGGRREPRTVRRGTLIGVSVVVALLVVGMEVRGNDGPPRRPEPPIPARSPEARLAALEPAPSVVAAERAVRRLSTFLDILEAECPANTRRELAALAYRGVEELRARGIDASPTDVFNGVMALDDAGRSARCGPSFRRSVARVAAAGS